MNELPYEYKLRQSIANHFGFSDFRTAGARFLATKDRVNLDYMMLITNNYYETKLSLALYKKGTIRKAFLVTDQYNYPVLDVTDTNDFIVSAFNTVNPFVYEDTNHHMWPHHLLHTYLSTPVMEDYKSTLVYKAGNPSVDQFFETILKTISHLVERYNEPELKSILKHIRDYSDDDD